MHVAEIATAVPEMDALDLRQSFAEDVFHDEIVDLVDYAFSVMT